MLRANQLIGFGSGGSGPDLILSTGTVNNTNTPSFTVDLGGPGLKTVLLGFACYDEAEGNDPWDFDDGTLGGLPYSWVYPGGSHQAGTGTSFTGGATIRAIQTTLVGLQTATIPIINFSAVMDQIRMMAITVRGVDPVPIAFDGGTNQSDSDGSDFHVSTIGARYVIGATAMRGSANVGDMRGPGAEVTPVKGGKIGIGYDPAPAGGSNDRYDFDDPGIRYVIAGASFG